MSRTVIDVKDELVKKAKSLTGLTKKVDIVNYALERLVRQKEIEKILELKGKIKWEGDLEEMRRGRFGTR